MAFRRRVLRHPFEARILDIKQRLRPEPFDWYRFDCLANLTHFEKLLPGGVDSLVKLAAGEPLADIGAADGDLAFLLESLGCEVTAIDWPGTNANQMRGVELLRRELSSRIVVREVDVDDQFRLDGERFGLVFALGLLYHLKNPFYFVEKLAIHSRRAVFSTRILPRGSSREPIARLTSAREFENDPTNYWLFSQAGIERLLERSGWDVTSENVAGNGVDDRYFCLAQSRIAKTQPTIRLLDGWHEIENNAWRWTKREFAAVLENPPDARRLEFRFTITPELMSEGQVVTSIEIDGVPAGSESIADAGEHVIIRELPRAGARHELRVTLSRTFKANDRELGVIVALPSRTIADETSGLRLTSGTGFQPVRS